jgi:hypothetical protein
MTRASGRRLRSVPARRTEDQELTGILNEMPDLEVLCRTGWHRWALDEVMPGESWPDSVRAWPGRRGAFRIEEPCVKCGLTWRITDTLPGGRMDPFAVTRIVYDREWVTIPQGFKRGKRRIRQELYRRRGDEQTAAQVEEAAARTAVEEAVAAEAVTAPAPAPVKFSGAS